MSLAKLCLIVEGLLCIKDSRPIIQHNEIRENKGIGMYFRDISKPSSLKHNVFRQNLIEAACEKENIELKAFLTHNDAIGDIRIPQNYKCCLI